jgi:hypothetical protein
MRWWRAMLDAHDRLRASGIKPNTPDLPKASAGTNERNLLACERSLSDAGDDDEAIDRKMLHVVLVAEAEAVREKHLDWFKPALIWDPDRFTRAVDTTLEEARRGRVSAHRADEIRGVRFPGLEVDGPPAEHPAFRTRGNP